MAHRSDLAAVVPAAGYSRRMGTFKPLLPFGPATVIERVVATIREAGVGIIRVVVGWQCDRLVPVLERAAVPWVENRRFEDGMYASIQTGVASLPEGIRAFFLLPGDMPLIRSATLTQLIRAWDANPSGILYPCDRRRPGHPPLIGAAFIREILGETPPDGLRGLLNRHRQDGRLIEVEDPGIFADLDTPEDYRRHQIG